MIPNLFCPSSLTDAFTLTHANRHERLLTRFVVSISVSTFRALRLPMLAVADAGTVTSEIAACWKTGTGFTEAQPPAGL
jgi:hypothetical protein